MNRRHFLHSSAAGIAAGALAKNYAAEPAATPTKKVALIGAGWYGKADLLRLIQVAPVDVVALCDVDSKMLAG